MSCQRIRSLEETVQNFHEGTRLTVSRHKFANQGPYFFRATREHRRSHVSVRRILRVRGESLWPYGPLQEGQIAVPTPEPVDPHIVAWYVGT